MKITIAFLFLCVSSCVSANMKWTDDSWLGPGKTVDMVYLQLQNRDVIFRTTDGERYRYHWGDSEQVTPNAQVIYSTLLTALSTGQKVSIYYDSTDTSPTIRAELLNIKAN